MSAKPALRNLLLNKTKFDFVIAMTTAITLGAAYKFGVQWQRRKTIEDFHANYDAQAVYKRMKKAGVFQSINQKVEDGILTLD